MTAGLSIVNTAGLIDPNLDVWFATQADADTYLDWVLNGTNTGNDDDLRKAMSDAKGYSTGGHFGTIRSMPTAPNGAGFRRFSEIGFTPASDFHTGQNGEVGRGSDSMVIT